MTRLVDVLWGCHPEFRLTFKVQLACESEDGRFEESYLYRVTRLKPDGMPDSQHVPVAIFLRVMGDAAGEDMADAAKEGAEDARRAANDLCGDCGGYGCNGSDNPAKCEHREVRS